MNEQHFAWLGLKVRDKVTGFAGVVSSIGFDLYGCVQAVVSPPVNDKGELGDGRWLDLTRLEVLDKTPVMQVPGNRFDVAAAPGPAEKPAR